MLLQMDRIIIKVAMVQCLILFLSDMTYGIDKCARFKSEWFSRKYSYELQMKNWSGRFSGDVCLQNKCCDGTMAQEMYIVNSLKIQNAAKSHMKEVVKYIFNTTNSLQDFFQHNLEISKANLDKEFSTLYNTQYKENKQFFFHFFDQLKSYMKGDGKESLSELVDAFIKNLAIRILKMSQNLKQNNNNLSKSQCLAKFIHSKQYIALGDDLKSLLRASYTPARLFINYWEAVNDVLYELMDKRMTLSEECNKRSTQLFYCSLCSKSLLSPCQSKCSQVLSNCFGQMNRRELRRLNRVWQKLIKSLINLSPTVDNSFNLQRINSNMHVKMSQTIIDLQRKIVSNCQSRKVRSVANSYGSSASNIPVVQKNLSKMLKMIVVQTRSLLPHFKNFPQKFCARTELKAKQQATHCWNGLVIEKIEDRKPANRRRSGGAGGSGKVDRNNNNNKVDPDIRAAINQLRKIIKSINQFTTRKIRNQAALFKIKNRDNLNRLFQKPPSPLPVLNKQKLEESSGDNSYPIAIPVPAENNYLQTQSTMVPIISTIMIQQNVKTEATSTDNDVKLQQQAEEGDNAVVGSGLGFTVSNLRPPVVSQMNNNGNNNKKKFPIVGVSPSTNSMIVDRRKVKDLKSSDKSKLNLQKNNNEFDDEDMAKPEAGSPELKVNSGKTKTGNNNLQISPFASNDIEGSGQGNSADAIPFIPTPENTNGKLTYKLPKGRSTFASVVPSKSVADKNANKYKLPGPAPEEIWIPQRVGSDQYYNQQLRFNSKLGGNNGGGSSKYVASNFIMILLISICAVMMIG